MTSLFLDISFDNSFNSLLDPIKLVPLSECIIFGKPRRAMNRHRQAKNASVDKSETNSV